MVDNAYLKTKWSWFIELLKGFFHYIMIMNAAAD